jgi:hypothetical protein
MEVVRIADQLRNGILYVVSRSSCVMDEQEFHALLRLQYTFWGKVGTPFATRMDF